MHFSLAFVCLALLPAMRAHAGGAPSWEDYKSLFVAGDGRVIDYGQDHASTSESQGYGMLLAVLNDDAASFDRIWKWTRINMGVRKDSLMAWLWGRRPNGAWEIMDYNNATDGDTLIAMSLMKASDKWGRRDLRVEAVSIIRSMREKLSIDISGSTYLLPGYYGFTEGGSVTLNPSYLILSAYRLFAEADEKSFWEGLYRDSLDLLEMSENNDAGLPPDWLVLKDGKIQEPSRFGYDAIRVFLYLSWEKRINNDGLKFIMNVYEKEGYIPRWIDLKGGRISGESAHAGIYAILSSAASKAGIKETGSKLMNDALIKMKDEDREYYSYSLFLLSSSREPI